MCPGGREPCSEGVDGELRDELLGYALREGFQEFLGGALGELLEVLVGKCL